MEFLKIVLFSVCFHCVLCEVQYKAAFVEVNKTDVGINKYEDIILEASKNNVDILFLSSLPKEGIDEHATCTSSGNYDELSSSLSHSVRAGGVYVVIESSMNSGCNYEQHASYEYVVMERDGAVVAVYREPTYFDTKANITNTKMIKFTSDFDVTFAIVKEEDIFLNGIDHFDGIKNFIVTRTQDNIPYLIAEQLTSSWSYINEANVISPYGIFGGKMNKNNNIKVAELKKYGGSSPSIIISEFNHENSKTMNVEASVKGYTDIVCDGEFCCNFHIKTSNYEPEAKYYLSASEVVIQIKKNMINLQTCVIGSKSNEGIKFDKIKITGNFTDSILYPIASNEQNINKLNIYNKTIVEIYDTYIESFGVLSKKDKIDANIEQEYISYENIQEFFDYVWFRFKVLLFIVSIYVLEMI